MHKRLIFTAAFAALALAASAQVRQSELAGKYHLKAKSELWNATYANLVTVHDDFTFTMTEQEDGSFQLSSFFYSGMDASWTPLSYSATAQYSPSEQLLYVYSTEWMWDDWMDTFMDPMRDKDAPGSPMLYFMVSKDNDGHITLTTGKNSAGFYVLRNSQWEYAIDYPDVLSATKVECYNSVTPSTIVGEYDMSYYDFNGRKGTTTFSIERKGNGYVLTGMFGDTHEHPLYFDADGKGVYADVDVVINSQSRYTYYWGAVVGECRVMFHFDAEGRLVSDNYITYTPNWSVWYDALDAVATKKGGEAGVEAVAMDRPAEHAVKYDLSGRRAQNGSRLYIEGGKVKLSNK